MIVASLPTIPERKDSLQQVLRRILYEQTVPVDKLHIWLNGYKHEAGTLPIDERVIYHIEPTNPGPWVRYRAAESLAEGDVLLTLDDDLVYPDNYVEVCLQHFAHQGNASVVTFGGLRWDPCVEKFEYGAGRFHFSYLDGLNDTRKVAVLMGGVSAFSAKAAKLVQKVSFAAYEYSDDLFVSYALQKNYVDILCLPKRAYWIGEDNAAHAGSALYVSDAGNRHANFRSLVHENGFDATAGGFEGFLLHPRRSLVISDLCPPFAGSHALEDHLNEMCEQGTSVHLLAPVGSSNLSMVQRHVDVPYVIHAESVPEEGGRMDWFSPVRSWRNDRVQRESRRKFLRRLEVVMKKLQPTSVEWFGDELPAWWLQRFGNETAVSLH